MPVSLSAKSTAYTIEDLILEKIATVGYGMCAREHAEDISLLLVDSGFVHYQEERLNTLCDLFIKIRGIKTELATKRDEAFQKQMDLEVDVYQAKIQGLNLVMSLINNMLSGAGDRESSGVISTAGEKQ